jgi:NAD(P)-dependent dehydrogenase (short-subunit alcohol dehydrogenase family)
VLVGSQRGALGMANYSAYCPAKAAVHLLARSLACEWGPHGIQVNCLAPGLFRSDLTAWMWEDCEVSTRMLARVPHGRLGEPADFVGPVIFLASAASDWMTGAILHVDGGYTAG